MGEIKGGLGHSAALYGAITGVVDVVRYAWTPDAAVGARRVVETLAVTLQAALLAQHAPSEVSDAFVASRLAGGHGATLGTLDGPVVKASADRILERALQLLAKDRSARHDERRALPPSCGSSARRAAPRSLPRSAPRAP